MRQNHTANFRLFIVYAHVFCKPRAIFSSLQSLHLTGLCSVTEGAAHFDIH